VREASAAHALAPAQVRRGQPSGGLIVHAAEPNPQVGQ
jgi:hypothetical protein